MTIDDTSSLSLRSRVAKILPKDVKARLRALRSHLHHLTYSHYDHTRFARYSGASKAVQNVIQEDAEITKIYHAIEKGLALPSPRPGFGAAMIAKLVAILDGRLASGSDWTRACANSVNALTAYVAHAATNGKAIPEYIQQFLARAADQGREIDGPAINVLKKDELQSAIDFDVDRFFWSRHSIRNFAAGPFEQERILSAIDLARSAPSVCNRQSSRVLIVPNEGKNFDLLRFQNGNRGFGETAQAFLVITSDLNSFVTAEERYQAWIDGGMFSMALALALHGKGLGACCLNWSNSKDSDLAFRKAAGIPEHETIIMLMAVGAVPESLIVANSERLPVSTVARVFGQRT